MPEPLPRVERVGWLLGFLLCLAAPAFYVLLWIKPHSPAARMGWGLWVGLLFFVTVSGLGEPFLDVRQAMRDAGYGEEEIPTEVSLEKYLGQLGGGPLGALIIDWEAKGEAIRLNFKEKDEYFDSRESIARIAIGTGFSLMVGRGFDAVELRLFFQGRALTINLERAAFNAFFGMDRLAMEQLGESSTAFDASPLKNLPAAELGRFFGQFASTR